MLNNQRLLIALDLDGTLLTSKKTISKKTKKLIQDLAKEGHLIIIASGRPPRAIFNYYYELGLKTPMISYNGAYVFNPLDESFPEQKMVFDSKIIKNLITDLNPVMTNIMCENNDNMWLRYENAQLVDFFASSDIKLHFGEFDLFSNQNLFSIIGIQKPDISRDEIKNIISKYEDIDVWFWHGSPYFELYVKGFSKGPGLKYIANFYQIAKENIIVFGDADNDIDMFQVGHISVAMKNAKTNVLQSASRISLYDNDKEGIYHTLKQNLREYKT